mmetsp:Transcript_62272/g.151800  ORF Transcript_62272/g.151800 Transcript_62272/m.151800 type:complete len:87 (+) Transcript_62272:59-319(+)
MKVSDNTFGLVALLNSPYCLVFVVRKFSFRAISLLELCILLWDRPTVRTYCQYSGSSSGYCKLYSFLHIGCGKDRTNEALEYTSIQ